MIGILASLACLALACVADLEIAPVDVEIAPDLEDGAECYRAIVRTVEIGPWVLEIASWRVL